MPQVGISGILLQLTGTPAFTNITLPAPHTPGSDEGIFEGVETLIRTYWPPTSAEGFNLFIGGAGNFTMDGAGLQASHNCLIGYLSGHVITTGEYNVGIGVRTHYATTTGARNVAVGVVALDDNITGDENIAIGAFALGQNLTSKNIGIGTHAVYATTTGADNIGIGFECLYLNITGAANIAIGSQALYSNTYRMNVAIGKEALWSSSAGERSVAIGYNAGFYETGTCKLFIDSFARASEADARIKALIYGVFDAATANQYLTINGHFNILLSEVLAAANNAGAAGAGVPVGGVYRTNADPSILCIRSA
jgi:hypothetical protein